MLSEWINEAAPNAPYLVIFGILLATGLGLPMPEDIPLLIGGYLCGQASEADQTHPTLWIMIPGVMIAIVGSDVLLYYLGRWFGPTIHRHPILKRVVGNRNLARARAAFARNRGKFVFFARFLPGVRAPAYFTAGTFKMPLHKFLFWDGAATCLSAPWIVLVGYFFHDKIRYADKALHQGKTIGFVIIAAVILVSIGVHMLVNKKFARVAALPANQPPKPDGAKNGSPD